jgi:hypothetical protein
MARTKAMHAREYVLSKAFDPSKHPRAAAGQHGGGRFVSGGGGPSGGGGHPGGSIGSGHAIKPRGSGSHPGRPSGGGGHPGSGHAIKLRGGGSQPSRPSGGGGHPGRASVRFQHAKESLRSGKYVSMSKSEFEQHVPRQGKYIWIDMTNSKTGKRHGVGVRVGGLGNRVSVAEPIFRKMIKDRKAAKSDVIHHTFVYNHGKVGQDIDYQDSDLNWILRDRKKEREAFEEDERYHRRKWTRGGGDG